MSGRGRSGLVFAAAVAVLGAAGAQAQVDKDDVERSRVQESPIRVTGSPLKPSALSPIRKGPSVLVREPAPVPQAVTGLQVRPGAEWVELRFTTAEETVPVVAIGRRAPRADLSFDPRSQVAASFPFLGGKRTRHELRLEGLEQGKQYWYVLTAPSANGPLIRLTGTFTTPVRLGEPAGRPASQ
jgi:hypothetical protein